MDPAAHNPSAELREDLIYTVEYHCQEWAALPGEEYRETVAIRLQRMVSGLPWLFGALHPHVQDFLVSTIRIRPELPLQCEEPEDVQPGPLEDSRPGSSPPPSRRKRRSRRRRSGTAKQAAPVGESDCASLTQPKLSDPGLHDLSTAVSSTIWPSVPIVQPNSDNSAVLCLDSKDTIQRGTSVSDYSQVVLTSDLCVPEPSDSCSAHSVSFDLASMNVLLVELAEPKTTILHQTHPHTATSIVAPQNCFNQPVHSEVFQSELSHTPPSSSALDITVHAEELKPSETVCSVADAPSSDGCMFQPVLSFDLSSVAQSARQPVINRSVFRVSDNKMAASFVKLAKRLGLSVAELADQVKFCDPRQCMPDPVHYSSEPAVVGATSSLDCVAPHPVSSESASRVASPMDCLKIDSVSQPVIFISSEILKRTVSGVLPSLTCVRQHAVPQETVSDVVCFETASVTVSKLISSRTASSILESLKAVDFLGPACFKPRPPKTEFGTNNLVHPVTVTAPMLRLPPPVPVPRAARAQLSLAPVSVPRVRVAEVQLVPASVSSLAAAPFIPAPVPAPRVGLMDTQPSPAPVPVPRVRSAVTLPTPAPVSVPRVGAAEVQLAPAPTPAPRVKAARAQFVPAPVSVPRVGMAGVRPGPAPVPVPRRRAAKSQTPAQSPAQLPADPPSLQPPLQLALLSIAQSLAQLLAQFPVLLPAQSIAQLSAPLPVQSFALLPPQFLAPSPVQLSAQSLTLSPAQLVALQPVQLLPPSARSSCEPTQPAEDCVVLTKLGQTVCTAQPQPLHPKPTACPVQLQLASTEPEVSAPAGSAPLLAGGSGEPLQPSLVSAGGSGQPGQHLLVSAGGSGEPLQLLLHLLVSAGGSGEPLQPLLVSAGGSNSPSPGPASASASPAPGPAPASASAPPGPASASAPPTPSPVAATPPSGPAPSSPVAATPPSGPAPSSPVAATPPSGPAPSSPVAATPPSGPAPSSPVAATPPSGPAPSSPVAATPPSGPASSGPVPTGLRPVRPTLCCRRRLPRGRPPDPLCCRRRLPRGRPPDPFCCHCHFSRGRPPERPN
ncbi:hypothetical protein ACER0C_002917 [Sarotherodon galilaeus]